MRNDPVYLRISTDRSSWCCQAITSFCTLLMLLFVTSVLQSFAEGKHFATIQGKNIVGPDGHKIFLRGINLGNWLVPEGYMFHFDGGPASAREINALISELIGPAEARQFWTQFRENYITREDIEFIKNQGFNSVRVPFNFRLLTPEDSPGVWSGPGFELLDRLIGWCHQVGLWVILDMHCAPGGQTGTNIDDSWGYPWLFESPESQRRTIDVWRKIAERYRDEEVILGYDLLNEPIPDYPGLEKYNGRLEPLYRRIAKSVREVDAHHLLFLGGAQWDTNFKVFGPPFDPRLVYTFHKYWTDPTLSAIQDFIDFREKYSVPLWLGESGENSNEWIGKFRQLLEENDIGWCFWPYKKMDSTSCVASFERPLYWNEIVSYAREPGGTGEVEKRQKMRPNLEHAQAAFSDLIKKSQFRNCRINEGYLRALGLKN
jgi:endoglucanase